MNGCTAYSSPPPSSATLAVAPDNTRTADAVLVRFVPDDNERWSLRRADGTFACRLPCSWWVPPASGLLLVADSEVGSEAVVDNADTVQVVPSVLPAAAGESVTIGVSRTHALGLAGLLTGAFLVPVGVMGGVVATVSIASLAQGSPNSKARVDATVTATQPEGPVRGEVTASSSSSTKGRAADIVGLTLGVSMLAAGVGGFLLYRNAKMAGQRVDDAPAPTRLELAPGAAMLRSGTTTVVATPFGLSGSF
ncbi:MAG: hypothetical protein EOO75_17965 [Myxococcales bacterium]|nr:MAG: hypothetical protein EOO75_17965 [Myxococcales bacterium]